MKIQATKVEANAVKCSPEMVQPVSLQLEGRMPARPDNSTVASLLALLHMQFPHVQAKHLPRVWQSHAKRLPAKHLPRLQQSPAKHLTRVIKHLPRVWQSHAKRVPRLQQSLLPST